MPKRNVKRRPEKTRDPVNPCWFCRGEMIWGGDHSFDDCGMEGDGIVANLSCMKCEATAMFYTKQEE